ncbi:MAG: Porphobilinogen deaminase [Oscillospiraceae bacterium]|jgi:hydroxymethylbilane synthase
MTKRIVKIGSRKSKLARIQAEMVAELLRRSHPELEIRMITMDTTGDKLIDRPLDSVGGKGLFTLELEQCLRRGDIDLAVHSLKDMPQELPEDLPLLAYSRRGDPRDALVLPRGSVYRGMDSRFFEQPVGCSSVRRTVQLRCLCPKIPITPIRGNVPTRIQKMDNGQYGALLLAAAGLKRLGLTERIAHIFLPDEIIPAAGQGILAIQGRYDFDKELLNDVDDPDGRCAAQAERAVIAGLACGCGSPAAAYCTVMNNEIKITGFYMDPVTNQTAKESVAGTREEWRKLADKLSSTLIREATEHA